jgi:DeoR/GlpR family transcriptional regulator of sugar metabolism
MRGLSKEDRQAQILQQLRIAPALRVHELAARFDVTTETIRRDLNHLHGTGRLSRTYGGAAPLPALTEPALEERNQQMVSERMAIAQAAALCVEANDFLMMDAGSTNTHCARALALLSLPLQVATNSLTIANILAVNPAIKVLVMPGEYDAQQGMISGPETLEFILRYRANKAIFSATAVSVTGVSDANRPLASIKRAMITAADELFLMMDNSKFDHRSVETFCDLATIDRLFVDRLPDVELLSALELAKVDVQVAPAPRLRTDRSAEIA